MGLDIAAREKYLASVKKLFPQGEYWDAQFADPESDVSLFCEAKLDELIRFRERMSRLQDESRPESTDELIADWERVLLDSVSYGLDLNQRRLLLKSKQDVKLNRAELDKIAEMYGLSITSVEFPFRPFFCGFTRLSERLGTLAAFSVLLITAARENFKAWAWEMIQPGLDAARIGVMHCGIDRLAHFPVRQLQLFIAAKLRRSSCGFMRCGIDRLSYLSETIIMDNEKSAAFDAYFQEQLLSETKFKERLEDVMADAMILSRRPFGEFEAAIKNKLLANQIAYFKYGGE